ncbi:MAG: hypothetical protein CVU51_10555 [Deltaproteobacteria bacterium HGW-Deltaproteobacteria-1]|nr:MAG: hypothetical protein CVU51_10555 [Deltaproteobacteria bacterium HGW-Deltaproteobacteria-1]
MKRYMTEARKVFLLLLMVVIFPMITWAGEESGKTESEPVVEEKTVTESKESEPQQEKHMITGEVAASLLSAYIWRGQEMTRHGVVVQPSATIGYRGFSVNIWGNIDARPYSAGEDQYSTHLSEMDVTLSYTHKFGIVSLGAGYIYYGLAAFYPGGTDPLDAQEIFVTMSVDTLLTPTLTIYKEIDHYHQWYATLGVSHTFKLHERVGLKLAGQISYLKSEDETTYPKFDSDSLATTDKFNNFHDATITISLPVAVTNNIAITPLLTYVFPLSSDARYEMKARGLQGTLYPSDKDSSSFLYGGVTLSFAF